MSCADAQSLLAPVARISRYFHDTLCAPEFGEEAVMRRVLVAKYEAKPRALLVDLFCFQFGDIDIVLGEERCDLRTSPAALEFTCRLFGRAMCPPSLANATVFPAQALWRCGGDGMEGSCSISALMGAYRRLA